MPSFDEVKLTTTLRGTLATYNPSTGANKNADSLPTGLVYKISDGTTLAATVTVANITTGVYRFSVDVTTGNGFAEGEYYELWITAVVSGDTTVTQSAPITAFKATTSTVDDLPTNAELATALGTADDAVLAAIATVQSDTNDIQTRLPAALESGRIAAELDSAATAALVDLIWDEPLTKATHNVATSSGKRLRQTTAFQQIDSTVIDASATTTTFATDLDSAVDNFYNDSMLVFTDGALAGQVRAIYDYVAATKTIILEEALTSAPANGVAFAIVSLHIHPVSQIQSGLATASALSTQAAKINKIEAATSGTVTGAGTSTEVFVGPSATLTITVDSSGNRSAVVVT
jgi:hypothetical protein